MKLLVNHFKEEVLQRKIENCVVCCSHVLESWCGATRYDEATGSMRKTGMLGRSSGYEPSEGCTANYQKHSGYLRKMATESQVENFVKLLFV